MKIFKVILIAWIVIWIFFTVRDLAIEKDRSTLKDYMAMLREDWEGKRSAVFGSDFYRFLKFCKASIPSGAGYEIIGIAEDSIDLPRLVYYLYPCFESRRPGYILVYKKAGFSKDGAYPYALFDKESFILKYK